VILAIGQDNAFPWIERDIGIEFGEWDMPVVDKTTFQSTRPGVFFGGDAAWGPENIIWAVEHGHQAAISIHLHCTAPAHERPPQGMNLLSEKMGLHQWSYSNATARAAREDDARRPRAALPRPRRRGRARLRRGADRGEVQRCLNCDIQTHFTAKLCIECDACIDICPVDCLTITHERRGAELRTRLTAPALNPEQPLYVSAALPQTARVMVKDEDICVHCGLCAERCPTAAWDMRRSSCSCPTPAAPAGERAHPAADCPHPPRAT
jgi:formate dehydrogenase (NADP+) beta subunit